MKTAGGVSIGSTSIGISDQLFSQSSNVEGFMTKQVVQHYDPETGELTKEVVKHFRAGKLVKLVVNRFREDVE